MKDWLTKLMVDGLAFTLFYLWKFENEQGAGNIFLILVWLAIIVRFVVVFNDSARLSAAKIEESTAPKRFYDAATDLAYVGLLAWFGHMIIAPLLLASFILGRAAVEDERKKLKEKQE